MRSQFKNQEIHKDYNLFIKKHICLVHLKQRQQREYDKGVTDYFKRSGIFWGGKPTNRTSINKNI